MGISFDWDEANIAHIAEHDVVPAEAEQVIDNSPLYLDYSIQSGEVRHREIGETATGRIFWWSAPLGMIEYG